MEESNVVLALPLALIVHTHHYVQNPRNQDNSPSWEASYI